MDSFLLEVPSEGCHNDRMKNKNNKNAKLIKDLQEMVNQCAMAGDQFKNWRESWMEVIEQLKKGYDYERALETELIRQQLKA